MRSDGLSELGSLIVENSETWRANRVMFAKRQALNRLANGVTGAVEDINRELNYITLRDQSTGQIVKVDVRNMDTRRREVGVRSGKSTLLSKVDFPDLTPT